jgi:catechol 2,3-dioxygenase-like lactoylglutathione lyase family enzyme
LSKNSSNLKRASREPFPDLGGLDVCLKVKDIDASVNFYGQLGFRQTEGEQSKGWSVQERNGVRVGLFRDHIKENTLNFRGGDIGAIAKELEKRGLKPYDVRVLNDKGVGNAYVKDPDGNVIFFDSTPEELQRRKAQMARL